MEALLSLAFDSLSSFDGPRVRKGMRQVEGLLAQICLSDPADAAAPAADDDGNEARPASSSSSSSPPPKDLARLSRDPAFREFFKLQEGFEWNVALRLIGTLDRLMTRGSDGQNDILILSALDLIQGLLLLHSPSKALFAREQNMNVSPASPHTSSPLVYAAVPWTRRVDKAQLLTIEPRRAQQLLLDLLEPFNCPAIQSAALLTLVVALVDAPVNTRTFEALDGLLNVTSLFKSRSTTREVKLKLVEFLYCYLLPETPSIPRAGQRDSVRAMLQRSPSKLAGSFAANAGTVQRKKTSTGPFAVTLTTEEKQELLSRHLRGVEDLVKDLRNCAPFGGVVC